MDDAQGYHTQNLELLRDDVEQLRNEARAERVLVKPRSSTRKEQGAPRRPATTVLRASDSKGKQVAHRMRAILRRGESDNSPIIEGTDFTESGLEAFLSQLTTPRKKARVADRIMQHIYKFLTAPPPNGVQTVVGVSADKVRQLARLLERIEQHGWEQVRLALAEKRAAIDIRPVQPEKPTSTKRKRAQARGKP